MILEESSLYKDMKKNIQVKIDLDKSEKEFDLKTDVAFRYIQAFPMGHLDEWDELEHDVDILIKHALYDILGQCGITADDIATLESMRILEADYLH